ncbi:MAG: dihydropyrimidinase [Anaerolineae bacterium]|nr:dihydropyrimidinase [Anaerolineae bacterium]
MSQFDLVIQKGTVVTADDVFEADVGIAEGMIVALGQGLTGERAIDVEGKYVLPGLIDAHVHLQLPVGGQISADDFETGSIAAACGGTTTIVDFVTPRRGQALDDAVCERRAEADGWVVVDYALHLTAIDALPDTLSVLPTLAGQGYTTLKLYTTYPTVRVSDGEMLALFEVCRENGILPLIHAENDAGIAYLQRRFLAQGNTGVEWHARSRPPIVEAEAVQRVLALASLVGTPIYLVHLSTEEAVECVRAARDRGQTVYAEVCAQHLLLSDRMYDRPDFESANFVLSPPLRGAQHQKALWRALARGELDVVSTDHCPWTRAQRECGREDFTRIPNGIPGIETRGQLIWEEGVNKARLSLERMVEVCATAPARLMGLYPRKGTIAVGSDADLAIWDPARSWTLRADELHHTVDHCPYEGWQGHGAPCTVLLRGQVIVRDGEFIGRTGQGVFVPRCELTARQASQATYKQSFLQANDTQT